MNDLLLSEISSKENNQLSAIMLVEEFIFGEPSIALTKLDNLVAECNRELTEFDDPIEKAEHLINMLFIDLLFLDNARLVWPVGAFRMKEGVEHRFLSPAMKAVVLNYIIRQCGFVSDLVFVPEKIMVRLICDTQYAMIFEPVTGESLNWSEFDSRMDELGGDPMETVLEPMETQAILLDYLTACKSALIQEGCFDKALKCVDVLLALRPDDPFERRDRGFLLHQLDCFKVAYDDYQYFVEQCPKDPAAQLLKIQLDKITINETILH